MPFRSTFLRSTAALMLSAGGAAFAFAAPVPFDLGLPPFEVLMQSLPKWGDNLVEVNVSRERYDVARDAGKGGFVQQPL